jgi:hypothetical protein
VTCNIQFAIQYLIRFCLFVVFEATRQNPKRVNKQTINQKRKFDHLCPFFGIFSQVGEV